MAISLSATFSAARLPLVDRGLIVALAHIRGGGDLGKPWHDAGKMMNKKNTFTDFIASAEYLTSHGYGSKSKIGIEGASAGGLLMGAVTNMRPDLFRAVLCEVPFVDVMNTMLDASLPLTVPEYEEWGNPNTEPAFDYMLSYSPYDNLAPKDYPAIMVRTSFDDSQVMYWEPAKYVSKVAHFEDRPESAHLLYQHARRSRGIERPLRPHPRGGLQLGVPADPTRRPGAGEARGSVPPKPQSETAGATIRYSRRAPHVVWISANLSGHCSTEFRTRRTCPGQSFRAERPRPYRQAASRTAGPTNARSRHGLLRQQSALEFSVR